MGENQFGNGSQENYRVEYNVVASTWRFFVSIRFIVAAFAVTLHSALLTLYNQFYQQETVFGQLAILGIPLAGLVASLAIFLIERRTINLYLLIIQRGIEIENLLKLQEAHFQKLAEPYVTPLPVLQRFISHTAGIYILYVGVQLLWIGLVALSITRTFFTNS